MPNIQTCYSTELFSLFEHHHKIVVIIDVMRATSAICSAFENGVKKIIPVSTVAEANEYQKKGYLIAGERDGFKLEQFDFGNSPHDFNNPIIKDKTLVLTTTNGTNACNLAKNAKQVLIGAFSNLSALNNYIEQQNLDVLLFCSGWKGKFNIEDTLFAGALANELLQNKNYESDCDSTNAAMQLHHIAKPNLIDFVYANSYRINKRKEDLKNDINYCFTANLTKNVPYLSNGELIV